MNLEEHFADYAAHHADPRNRATHYVGLPLIALCLFGLGAKVRLAEPGGVPVDLGLLLAAALVAVYLAWRWRLALGVAALFVPLYLLGARLPASWLLALLALGVGLQYLGHYAFERRAPAFHRNLAHTLVGPLWMAAGFFRALSGRSAGRR